VRHEGMVVQVSKKVNNVVVQNVSKSTCWGVALAAAKKELMETEERRALLLEAIPVFERLAATEAKAPTEAGAGKV